jgi:hypothetical protein
MYRGKNRRRHARYGVGSLRVWVHRRGVAVLFGKRCEVVPIDFNTKGMGFRCLRPLTPGERLVFDVVKDRHRVTNVIGVVREIARLANHCRVGVEFDFEADDHMRAPETKAGLRVIETLLKDVVVVGGVA